MHTNKERERIKNQIIEYMKMYVPQGEPIGAEKILRLIESSQTTICPLCNGVGVVHKSMVKTKRGHSLHIAAKKMLDSGMTYREVAKLLGFKHPGSISNLINQLK